MHLAAELHGDFAQLTAIALVVDWLEEARASVISALDNMLSNVGEVETRRARHL
jgi:hypothetical protein